MLKLLAFKGIIWGFFLPLGWAQVEPDSAAVPVDTLPKSGPAFLYDTLSNQTGVLPGPGLPGDSTQAGPSPRQRYQDSLKTNSDLQAPVSYSADDSIVFDVKNNAIILYQSSKLDYEEIKLEAYQISVNMDSNLLIAQGRKKATNPKEGRPKFTQDGNTYDAEHLKYNFKTQKGKVIDGRMVEGEGFVIATVAKYHEDGSFHGKDGKYTTCNLDHPHYFIRSRRLKMLKNNRIISGPLQLVLGDFPIPIVIPFGFLPKLDQQGRKNGIIFPQYGEAQERGFYLRGLGYYLGISDNLDLKIDGDIYTRGGWRLGMQSQYNFRYRFSGRFGFQYGVQRFNEPRDPDFRKTAAWSLNWSHQQPIDPTARISASVNISSSSSFQRNISYSQNDFFTNNLSSSVSFSKKWNNLPFSLNMSMRHNQDLNKGTMSMQLPELTFTINRQTLFKNIRNNKLKFLRQLGVNYNMQARNSVRSIPDSILGTVLFNWRDSVDVLEIINGDSTFTKRTAGSFYENGAQHRASVSTTIKFLKQINISPSFNMTGYQYTQTLQRTWDPELREVVDTRVPGFRQAADFNFSVGASTNFYGIYQLTRSKKELTFRQRFSPTVSYNLKPDFADPRWGYYEEVQVDTTGRTQLYSIFQNGIFRGPSRGESQALSFSLSSVIEMKYRSKESFEDDFDEKQDKYVRTSLIDNLSASTFYNFAADSFQLSPIRLSGRTSLFKSKVNLTTSMTLDPYVFGLNEVEPPFDPGKLRRQNRFLLNEDGRLGRVTNAQVSLSTRFQSKRRAGSKSRSEDFDEEVFEQVQNTIYEYVDFDIPWDISLRYNLSYNNQTPGLNKPRVTSTVNVNGSFNFTPNWKIQYQTGYDLARKEVNQTRISIFRDLHCWEMSFSWIPFGRLKSYSLTINVRSATLKDLRLTRNQFWQDQFR